MSAGGQPHLAEVILYRGSSFLLWKDYRIHRYAVRELLKPKSALREAYVDHAVTVNGRREKVNVTDTLATKILLAAFGCTPAYDWYFVEGLRSKGIAFSEFNEAHFVRLCEFYRNHAAEFKRIQRRIHENGVKYPKMRLVDMYFWEVGRRISE